MSEKWSGVERRSEAQLSEQRLQTLERLFGIFGERLDNLIKSTHDYQSNSKEAVDALSSEIRSVLNKLTNLPCDKRAGWYDSIANQMRAVWVILISLTLWLFKEVFK